MDRENLECLRELKRMRRDHLTGEDTPHGLRFLNAAIGFMETGRAMERLDAATPQGDEPVPSKLQTTHDLAREVCEEFQREAASAAREEGIEEWATLLPGFDKQFPPETEEE